MEDQCKFDRFLPTQVPCFDTLVISDEVLDRLLANFSKDQDQAGEMASSVDKQGKESRDFNETTLITKQVEPLEMLESSEKSKAKNKKKKKKKNKVVEEIVPKNVEWIKDQDLDSDILQVCIPIDLDLLSSTVQLMTTFDYSLMDLIPFKNEWIMYWRQQKEPLMNTCSPQRVEWGRLVNTTRAQRVLNSQMICHRDMPADIQLVHHWLHTEPQPVRFFDVRSV